MENLDLGPKPAFHPNNLRLPSKLLVVGLITVLIGVGAGFILSSSSVKRVLGRKVEVAPGAKVSDKVAGIEDERTFRDQAAGVLEKGGIDGEGSHHLVRPGGESQNVYLTSSIINLDDFLGKKVEVWGETQKGQRVGWLMAVGKLKVVE